MARKGIGKKLRFEVFKRDKFTCTYCGRKAPDVILHVDHIEPVADGGTNDILNLTTSCFDCNAGKGKRRLSDGSVVEKQRAQLEALQERQEQIRMMIDWQRSLLDLDSEAIDAAESFWCDLAGWHGVTEDGRQDLRKMIRKFGLEELLAAMRDSTHYFKYDDDGEVTSESANHAFNKLSGICAIKRAEGDNPNRKPIFYIRAVVRNRFSYIDLRYAKTLLELAFEVGADQNTLYRIAADSTSWTDWKRQMHGLLDELDPDGVVVEHG